ncbi:MAG: 5-(carboxyamino)imidazole ribonucleotide synthase [Synergistetes bacterium]|nr:5-(carboxyamino)imidazole ribonucleotide synthase [Synergistota bacterium]MDW8192869.1 5-(carboxyamino)imidazole ribonucleotide synthase [Synergistota bacterium]
MAKTPGITFKTIGIIGGGQLGKMLAISAAKLGFEIVSLDPSKSCPISTLCRELITGSLMDEEKIFELAKKSDLITFEIEHINVEALKKLIDLGYQIHPSPLILEIVKDKLKQREYLKSNGFPVPNFKYIGIEEIKLLKPPFVQKARTGGYDGRGVAVIKDKKDLSKLLVTDSYVEDFIEIEKEIASLVVRNSRGEIASYPVVEMIFDQEANILDMLISPAELPPEISKEAINMAKELIKTMDGIGVFAIEMFLSKDGRIFINEIAPRVHNSGHHTIESCLTSQFEQHIRAITSLPLGSTRQIMPAAMINLLGEPGYRGKPIVIGLEEALSIPGVNVHIYGKSETRPYRKIGHVTIVGDTIEEVKQKAKIVREKLKVIGDEKYE